MFMFKDKTGNVRGYLGAHVDDLLMCGDEMFWKVVATLEKTIKFGSKNKGKFVYCGNHITCKVSSRGVVVTID